MSLNGKQQEFTSFVQKAKQKLEERKKQQTVDIYVKELDEKLTFRAITENEFAEIMETYADESLKQDKYCMYTSCKQLQDLAVELVKENTINEHIEVIDMFKRADRTKIVQEILKISGIYEEADVEILSETEEVKNC